MNAVENKRLMQEIFARIAVEVEAWRFRAAPLSTRQLRRMVYG